MKKKLLAITLLATLLITGCGSSKPNAELDKFANEIDLGQTKSTTAPTEAPTEAPASGNTEAPTAAPTSGATEAPAEEEKYYFTFSAPTTEDDTWDSGKFANSKLTMINVWGTYCGPCLNEMPSLGEIATEYDAAEFQLIGVICDVMEGDSQAAVDAAKELITETGANYPHLLANESVYVSFLSAVSVVPTTFFVRQDGSLIGYVTGALDKESWKSLIDQLLAEEQ